MAWKPVYWIEGEREKAEAWVAEKLGRRLARGEQAAFAELYDAYADRLHHYLVVRLGSRADADDVLQETFVRLARSRKRLEVPQSLEAYVFTVARNESIRFLGQRSRESGQRVALMAEDLFSQAGADGMLAPCEQAEIIAAALAQLRPEQREIVELKVFAGLTFAEIATVTGVPQGTLATRYRTAMERLRRWGSKEPA